MLGFGFRVGPSAMCSPIFRSPEGLLRLQVEFVSVPSALAADLRLLRSQKIGGCKCRVFEGFGHTLH